MFTKYLQKNWDKKINTKKNKHKKQTQKTNTKKQTQKTNTKKQTQKTNTKKSKSLVKRIICIRPDYDIF